MYVKPTLLVVLLLKGYTMEDILVRLQNQPKINGAHPKDIEDAIKEIIKLRDALLFIVFANLLVTCTLPGIYPLVESMRSRELLDSSCPFPNSCVSSIPR